MALTAKQKTTLKSTTTKTPSGRIKKKVPGNAMAGRSGTAYAEKSRASRQSYAGQETDKKKTNGEMAPPVAKKEVKKAVKKTATAAKKTVKKAVAAVKKVVKKTARAGGGRAAEAGRKAWYT